jgi:hypothetical protein
MEALLAFAAALLALRLAGGLVTRWRARRRSELLAWAGSLGAYAAASAALAWGSAAGWGDEVFRAFYLFGGLLTAPLLGLGSLLLVGRRAAIPVVLVYCGLAAGVAISEPLTAPVSGDEIPDASEHLGLVPARVLAILGNSLGTLAAVGVALRTIRRRPLGNLLLLAGIVTAAAGSALAGLGAAEAGVSIAVAAALLYGGFILNK